jgi:hypothetical protein
MRSALAVAGATMLLAVTACSSGTPSSPAPSTTVTEEDLAVRTAKAGEVEVKIEPNRIDDDGADIKITLDTHTVELDADLPDAARLVVDDVEWTAVAWEGDGPEGHHREGRVTFEPTGPARGKAVLTLDELPEPVEVSWDLGMVSLPSG